MNSQNRYLLRIEAVNFFKTVLNTNDLSTIRGGSLALLNATSSLEKHLQDWMKKIDPEASIDRISSGASIGLFRIACLATFPNELRGRCLTFFSEEPAYSNYTIMVDCIEESNDSATESLRIQSFARDSEYLCTANRWRQMQSPTLYIPPRIDPKESNQKDPPACALDGKSAAGEIKEPNRAKNSQNRISDHLNYQREYGRRQKQDFYAGVIQISRDYVPNFAPDFEAIALGSFQPELNGKIGIFYADGNKFGRIQKMAASNPEYLEIWDRYLKEKRASFLRNFLKPIIENQEGTTGWRIQRGEDRSIYGADFNQRIENEKGLEGAIRFETLLWGGDEVMFVMPAEMAWLFSSRFFQYFQNSDLDEVGFPEDFYSKPNSENEPRKSSESGFEISRKTPLTYSAGLVYANHHTPIARLKNLVKDQMTDGLAKKQKNYWQNNHLTITCLESFDNVGDDISLSIRRRYSAGSREFSLEDTGTSRIKPEDTIFSSRNNLDQKLVNLAETIAYLKPAESGFARNQLRKWVIGFLNQEKIRIGETEEVVDKLGAEDLVDHYFQELRSPSTDRQKETKDRLLEWLGEFKDCQLAILRIEEYWDYAR